MSPRKIGTALSYAQTGGLLGHSFGPAIGTLFATLVTHHHTLFWFSGAFMLCGGSLVLFTSYSDMRAALCRELIRHEFWTQAPPMTTTPKLAQPQTPSASKAA